MSNVQEVQFFANTDTSNIKFNTNIISHSDGTYSAESIVYDPTINPTFSSLHPLGNQFASASDAFQAIAEYIDRFLEARSAQIQKIDNPCNDITVKRAEQQNIVNGTQFFSSAIVLVNGA